MNNEKIGSFWRSFKIDFKGRFTICTALILSLSIFNSFSDPLVKFAATIATLVTAELFIYCYFGFYLESLILLLKGSKSVEVPLPTELVDLSKKMGLKITKMKMLPKICNAFVRGKQLFIGETLLERLDSEELKAVVAHEFGHIKGRHIFLQFFYMLPILACVSLNWGSMPPIMLELGLFAYMMVILVPIHWRFEKRADHAAAKFVGKEPLKSALQKIVEKDEMNTYSETHPAPSQRITWIDESKV